MTISLFVAIKINKIFLLFFFSVGLRLMQKLSLQHLRDSDDWVDVETNSPESLNIHTPTTCSSDRDSLTPIPDSNNTHSNSVKTDSSPPLTPTLPLLENIGNGSSLISPIIKSLPSEKSSDFLKDSDGNNIQVQLLLICIKKDIQ